MNIEEVDELLKAYKSDPKDWKKYAKFDRYKYTRNLVHEGNGKFNLVIFSISIIQSKNSETALMENFKAIL